MPNKHSSTNIKYVASTKDPTRTPHIEEKKGANSLLSQQIFSRTPEKHTETLGDNKRVYLHEEGALISQGRGQMLQASGLEPPSHDSITSVVSGTCIMQGPTAGVVVKGSRRRSIALLHLAAHVALRTSLRSQFSRSV